MDFSRLNVTALDNNKNNIEKTAIVFVGFKPTYFLLFFLNMISFSCVYLIFGIHAVETCHK